MNTTHLTSNEFRSALYDEYSNNDIKHRVVEHLAQCKLCSYSVKKERTRNVIYQGWLKAENKEEYWAMIKSIMEEIKDNKC